MKDIAQRSQLKIILSYNKQKGKTETKFEKIAVMASRNVDRQIYCTVNDKLRWLNRIEKEKSKSSITS